jgi:hypothetical protein
MTVSNSPKAQLVNAAICDIPLNTLHLFVAVASPGPNTHRKMTVLLSAAQPGQDHALEQFPFTVDEAASTLVCSLLKDGDGSIQITGHNRTIDYDHPSAEALFRACKEMVTLPRSGKTQEQLRTEAEQLWTNRSVTYDPPRGI